MHKRWIKKLLCAFKLLSAWLILNIFMRRLYREDIWLIKEKIIEARDNSYYLYKYIRENHPEVNAYYVITRNSADYDRVGRYGNIIDGDSFKHYIYYWAAKMDIGSQIECAAPSYTRNKLGRILLKLRRKDGHSVFLQHGVTKDVMPKSFYYKYSKLDVFVSAAGAERQFVIDEFGYPEENVKLLGFCRWDRLHYVHNSLKDQILIMPTFRSWLQPKDLTCIASDSELREFEKSEFYAMYAALLLDKRFNDEVRKRGFKIVFYPHYAIQPYISSFKAFDSDLIRIADRSEDDVQQLLIESKLLITDFSSVFFDFAYMRKPEIFYQFDEEKFRSLHYGKGYFDYRRDGFGPVIKTKNSLVDKVLTVLDNQCRMSELYLQRAKRFFDICDAENCKRTYDAIAGLK